MAALLQGKRFDFTAENAAKAPNELGLYQIEDADGKVIYIGQGNIRERLLSHFRCENAADRCIFDHYPTHYRREPYQDCADREAALLRQFSTFCNVRVG